MNLDNNIPIVDKELIKSDNAFPVVGIGASAGGLVAFKNLLGAITVDSGMAYVLLQHLDPNHESMLPEILQKVCKIPVQEVTDDVKVEPNRVYVIPSNKIMIATDGILMLAPRPERSKSILHHPIDLFFKSLAEIHLTHAIGIILSGTGQDGTIGLRAIKAQGGLTLVQDDSTAAYEGMPKSAVEAGVVDFILTPEKMPEKLLEITRNAAYKKTQDGEVDSENEDTYRQIIAIMNLKKGIDFNFYKQTTIRRRIQRRMALNNLHTLDQYFIFLKTNKSEQLELLKDALISVTSFFRDPNVFDNLSNALFPLLIENKQPELPIRIWVAGCSTGEEAYSMAICMHELFQAANKESNNAVQIFATDINEFAIEKARSGIYSHLELEGISPQRLQTYFRKFKNNYQVIKPIRDLIVFANHNFLSDPPFGKVDFISCRNVLIYMEPYLQKKALTTFHYALNLKFNSKGVQTSGFLLLGKSETTSGVPNLFSISTKYLNIFKRKDAPSKYMPVTSITAEKALTQTDIKTPPKQSNNDFQKTADDLLLTKYAPTGVVVNDSFEIVQFRGSPRNYLEQQSGKPSHNILTLAKHGLSFELRNLLHKVKRDKTSVIKKDVSVEINGELRNINIEALPLPNTIEPYYLILFHDLHINNDKPELMQKQPLIDRSKLSDKDKRINQLEQEITVSREDMRVITEEQELVNGDLQSINEELMSSSEELQSLNEELETSKEELQSTNEELTVVNQEMITLSEQITEAKNYAESIVENIREPLLVLDKNLRVKTANNAFYEKFQVTQEHTEGNLIYNLGNKQWDIPELRMLLENILPKKSVFNAYEVLHTFPEIGSLTMLLNAREVVYKTNTEKLILLSIEDITERKYAEQKIAETEHKYSNFINSSNSLIAILSGENYIVEIANEAIINSWGKGKNVIGKPLLELIPELKLQGFEEILNDVYHTATPFNAYEHPVEIKRHGKSELAYYNFTYQPQISLHGKVEGISVIAQIVTPQAILNKQIKESEETFRQLAEITPKKIATADSKGKFYYFNENWRTFAGKSLVTLIENGWMTELHADELALFKSNWKDSIKTGKTFEMEMRLLGADGYYQWNLTRVLSIRDEFDNVFKWIIAATPIQQQIVQREILESIVSSRTQQLKSLNNELQQTNKELESFAYVSSHDLQEPLRKIQTFASLIKEKESKQLSSNAKQYFDLMYDAASRMQKLIDDLLTFSRLSKADRNIEEIDINHTIEQLIEEFKEKIKDSKATIIYDQNCTAHVIAFQFYQLMHNLIGNALKFGRQGIPPIIIIKSRLIKGSEFNYKELNSEQIYLHLLVTDNGIGFDNKYNKQIFEVFQKLHAKEEYSGTGIGLSIVKKIVDTHHGFIFAKGKPDEGATFEIFLPESDNN